VSRWLAILCWPALWLLFRQDALWHAALAPLASQGQDVLYQRSSLADLASTHMLIVAGSMSGVLALGLPLAVWVTRRTGRPFLPIVSNTVAMGQTFPPVAVLFLALPIFGFGPRAVVLALFLYGLMPVVQGTLVGLQQVSADVRESALGMGMSSAQMLFRTELVLALPAILAGTRTSLILLISTATLAPMVGGTSLGTPIISGLTVNNSAQVLEGALAVALLAVAADYSLRVLERWVTPWR